MFCASFECNLGAMKSFSVGLSLRVFICFEVAKYCDGISYESVKYLSERAAAK